MTEFLKNPTEMVVLLVDDNKADMRLTEEVLKQGKIKKKIFKAQNGEEALDFLYKKGEYKNAPCPDLILLDLNMPRKNGFEVLEHVKNDGELKKIPVVILSTSNNEPDVEKCYKLSANCYLVKPVHLDQFFDMIQALETFWLHFVRFPQI